MNALALEKHAVVFMGGFRLIINALEDEEKLIKTLRLIAKSHVKWNIHKSHVMVYFFATI